jgi:hypothetical protein
VPSDSTPGDFSDDIESIGNDYPALKPILQNTVVKQSKPEGPDDDRQLEFYPPWETDNPNPGKSTVELFRDMEPTDRREAIAGDLLHHLGAINPATNQPVDSTWYGLKQELGAARTPQHLAIDQQAYAQEKANPNYETSPYPEWDQSSRLDAYVRGGMFPRQNPEWQEPGFLTPQMHEIFGRMRQYLTGAQQATGQQQ